MSEPRFRVDDRVRVMRTGPAELLEGKVCEVDTKTLGARTIRGPRYRIAVNGRLYPQWFHEIDLAPAQTPERVS